MVCILRVVDSSYRALNPQEGENRTFEPAGKGDMDVTSPAVPYVTIVLGGLLENHGSKKLSTKVPLVTPTLKNPTNRNCLGTGRTSNIVL